MWLSPNQQQNTKTMDKEEVNDQMEAIKNQTQEEEGLVEKWKVIAFRIKIYDFWEKKRIKEEYENQFLFFWMPNKPDWKKFLIVYGIRLTHCN